MKDNSTEVSANGSNNHSMQRAILIILIVIILAGLFVLALQKYSTKSNNSTRVFTPAGTTTTTSTTTTSTTTTQNNNPAGTPEAVAAYDARLSQPNASFDLTFQDNKLVSGPTTITVKHNDSVAVNVYTLGDHETHLKLDGYNITTESDKDGPGGFKFVADKTGTFRFYAVADEDSEGSAPVLIGSIIVQ